MAEWKKVIVSGSGADLTNISASGHILPKTDNAVNLGSSTHEFKDLYLDGVARIDSVIADTADINAGTVDGITSLTAAGDLDIGAHGFRAQSLTADGQTSGRVAIYGTNGVLSEDSDLSFSGDTLTATKIGAFTAAGSIDFGSQAMTNVDINSGTIDGATIATSDVTVGTGKTLNVSGGSLTTSAAQNKAIMQSGIANNDANVDFQGFEVRAQTFESDVATGTAPFVVASTTQVANLNASTLGGADFASPGTIGGTAAGVASFTTLNASAVTSLNGDVNLGNALLDDVNLKGHMTASAGVHISGSSTSTGSFGKLFGDGSALTGVTQNIDELSAHGSAIIHQTNDNFLVSISGTEKKLSFSNLEDAIFANMDSESSDVGVVAGGAVTIANDVVTNAKLANMTRGTIKVGGGSNAPTDLDAKTSGQILIGDGTDVASVAVSGDIAIVANGTTTIQADAVHASMLNDDIVSGLSDINALIAGTDELIVSDAGTLKRTDVSRLGTFLAGDGLGESSGVMNVNVDDSSIETNSDALRIKASGVTNAMLANDGITIAGNDKSLGSTITGDEIIAGVSNNAISGDKINGGTIDATTITALTAGSAVVTGDLVVEGNTVNAQVSNLLVEDRFALFNSGSASGDGSGDGGIIIQTESNFSGVAFGWDQSAGRFGTQVDTKLAQNAVSIAPDAYVASVVADGSDDATYRKNGNMRVSGGDIYIYVE